MYYILVGGNDYLMTCLYQLTKSEFVHQYINQFGVGDCYICSSDKLNFDCKGFVDVTDLIKPSIDVKRLDDLVNDY